MNFDLNLYFLWHNIVCEHGRYHSLWFSEEVSHARRVTPRTSTAMALGKAGELLKLSDSWPPWLTSRTLASDVGPCCSLLMFLKLRATALGTVCREVEEGRC